MENKFKSNILAVSIFLGLFLLGYFIFKGLKTFSDKDRVVTVKGLAEMTMKATSAKIDLSFSFSGDNLQEIIKKSEFKKNAIITYLTKHGYTKKGITIRNTDVTDREMYYETSWENNKKVLVKIDRYTIEQSLTLFTKDVENTEDKISEMKLDLISKDLTCDISSNYTFPELNSIKPKLIAKSTKNARVAGEQFANDSDAILGKIKTASQGQISVVGDYDYDEETNDDSQTGPYIQKVRVVSSIVFFLE